MNFLSKWSEEILGATRIVAAFMFIQHGTTKILAFPGKPYNAFELFTLNPGLAGILEVTLGPMLLLGLFSRQCAFILSGQSAFAYFMVHAGLDFAQRGDFWTKNNGGEPAVLYCFLFLYIAAHGGGKFSLDNLMRNKSQGNS